MQDVNDATFKFGPVRNDYIQAATDDLFSTQDYNANSEADRVKIGQDIIRPLYEKNRPK